MSIGSGWDPPADQIAWTEFSWFKVKGSRSLILVILNDAPVWYSGHFYKGRMIPCLGGGCKACADGIGSQLRYVFSCVEYSTKRVGLIEVSRTIAVDIKEMFSERQSMRGAALEFTKYSNAKNSRMIVQQVSFSSQFDYSMFNPPDIKHALVATWEKAGIEIPDELRELSHTPFHRGKERSDIAKDGTQEPQKRGSDGKDGFRVGARCFTPEKRVL